MEFPHRGREICFSLDDQEDVTKLHTADSVDCSSFQLVEKEHLFHKVVTPSDVGKLNRLVLPKQHAEKYFPLDSVANEKGLLLCFEDCNGKPWHFRYSYWNSSQSYVITKGWSRFVKDHYLDAGDTVSFARGRGDDAQNRLFIDCKRRQQIGTAGSGNHQHRYPLVSFNCPPFISYGPRLSGEQYVCYPFAVAAAMPRISVQDEVLNSVPVVSVQPSAKRVRLFGVNLDYPDSTGGPLPPGAELQPMSALPPLQLGLGSSSAVTQSPSDPGL